MVEESDGEQFAHQTNLCVMKYTTFPLPLFIPNKPFYIFSFFSSLDIRRALLWAGKWEFKTLFIHFFFFLPYLERRAISICLL